MGSAGRMRGEDFPRLLPRMQKTPLQWGYGEDSCILSTEKLAQGGMLLLFSHLSRATIGALGGLSAPFLSEKDNGFFYREDQSELYQEYKAVGTVLINA